MNIKGSQTEKNLQAAFSGESMARNKYTFFAEAARTENQPEIAELFETMAKNESYHGKVLYQALHGKIGNSLSNLNNAMDGEYGEWTSMYPEFAKTAESEGLSDIAELFKKIAVIEKDHEHRFLMALVQLTQSKQKGTAQPSVQEENHAVEVQGYRCMFCGATYDKRPDVCSLCGAIGSFENASFQKHI